MLPRGKPRRGSAPLRGASGTQARALTSQCPGHSVLRMEPKRRADEGLAAPVVPAPVNLGDWDEGIFGFP